MGMKENRKYTRLGKIIGIEYINHDGQKKLSMTRDMSVGGVAFITSDVADVGSRFKIIPLNAQGLFPLELTGKVVRCDKQENGCIIAGEFDELSENHREKLQKFIDTFEDE